jgi:hypothetical protein
VSCVTEDCIGELELCIPIGDAYEHDLSFVDELGDPVNMAAGGFTYSAALRVTPTSTAVAFAVDQSAAAAGLIVISLTAAQTAAGGGSHGSWALRRTSGSEPETVLGGPIRFQRVVLP